MLALAATYVWHFVTFRNKKCRFRDISVTHIFFCDHSGIPKNTQTRHALTDGQTNRNNKIIVRYIYIYIYYLFFWNAHCILMSFFDLEVYVMYVYVLIRDNIQKMYIIVLPWKTKRVLKIISRYFAQQFTSIGIICRCKRT